MALPWNRPRPCRPAPPADGQRSPGYWPGRARQQRVYAGAFVLGAAVVVSLMWWHIQVQTIDRDEALAEFHHVARLVALAASFLTLAFAGLLVSRWRQREQADLRREQLRQERALSGLRGYAETIVASVPAGLLVLGEEQRILSANQPFLEAFRLPLADVIGRRLADVVEGEGLSARVDDALAGRAPGPDFSVEVTAPASGQARPVRVCLTSIAVPEDEAARLLVILKDLSREEQHAAARRASEQRFRDLVESLDAIVWEADAATRRFTFVSRRAEQILGYPVTHWLGNPAFWTERIHPEDRPRAPLAGPAGPPGVDLEYEYRAVAADGQVLWLRDIVHVVRDGEGQARRLRGVTVDVTGRRRAEEALHQSERQLRQAQKMEAVGQLAGGVAHDFNNLLMVIQGDGDAILRRLPSGHPLRRNAESITEAVEQAAALTRQLLAFSRKQVLAPKVLDLGGVVARMQPMLQRLLGETIDLVTTTPAGLDPVKADPGQIEQVLLNLAVNARDAMPGGGRLTIGTRAEEIGPGDPDPRDGAAPGRFASLVVADTGCGISAETRTHLFEPFFTTKEPGRGTGLGLSTVYGIVKQSGGHIWVDSEPGRGATFTLCFPAVDWPAPEEPVPARPGLPAGQGETILLVEDAERVREVVREILEIHEYTVIEAGSGPEALAASEAYPDRIHLLLTDVVMPGMGGSELARYLVDRRPGLRVLYMSGYTDDAIVRHGVLAEDAAFIAKPFTPDGLGHKVREVLDGAPAHFPTPAPP